jgi:hypothetical protein
MLFSVTQRYEGFYRIESIRITASENVRELWEQRTENAAPGGLVTDGRRCPGSDSVLAVSVASKVNDGPTACVECLLTTCEPLGIMGPSEGGYRSKSIEDSLF